MSSENPGATVLAGKPSPVFEPFDWTREVVNKGWPDSEIVNLIRSHQIDLIVLSGLAKKQAVQRRWPNSVEVAIEENYRPVKFYPCTDATLFYAPKDALHDGGGGP